MEYPSVIVDLGALTRVGGMDEDSGSKLDVLEISSERLDVKF